MNDSPWPMVAIADIAKRVKRVEEPTPGIKYRQIGVRLWGEGAYERDIIDGINTKYRRFYRTEENDIIVNKIWARRGSVAVVPSDLANCYASSEFPMYAPDTTDLIPGWFHWMTKTKWFWEQCAEKSHGTSGKNRIRPERFVEIEIPLPPLAEQRQIVARVEALAAKVEAARTLREEAMADAQTILLTLLQQFYDKNTDTVVQIGEFVEEMRNGLSRRPSGIATGPIVLRLSDVSEGVVSLKNPRRGDLSKTEIEKYHLREGDLLFVRVNGSPEIVGRCIPFSGAKEIICYNDHLIRVRLNSDVLDWRYVWLISKSPQVRRYIQGTAITTAGQMTINQRMLKAIEFPCPPLSEQRRIVAYLDALQAKLNAVQEHQEATQARLDALLPAILDRAFRGEL